MPLEPLYSSPHGGHCPGWLSRHPLSLRKIRFIPAPERRIVLLIVAMLLMGYADLALTLTYMQSIGMIEMNPLARHMIAIGQTQQLVMFKLFTMALSAGAIFLVRRHPIAEKAAWACSAGLLALMVHWTIYNRDVSSNTNELTLLAESADQCELWVKLDS